MTTRQDAATQPTETSSKPTFAERALDDEANAIESIDAMFQRPAKRTWLGVLAFALLVLAGVLWTLVAPQVVEVSLPAVVIPEFGRKVVLSPAAGVYGEQVVKLGDRVAAGAQIATISDTDQVPVTSPIAGVVVSVDVVPGQMVAPGQTLVWLVPDETPIVIAMTDTSALRAVRVGQSAVVEVFGVDEDAFGKLRADVVFISTLPAPSARLNSLFGEVASAAFVAGTVHEVHLKPRPAPTPSGFEWTVGDGPDGVLKVGSPAAASVEISRDTLASRAFR